jgi:hypothetical protein
MESAPLSQTVFQNLLYTIRGTGFAAYDEGEQLPDGRRVFSDDPLKSVRHFEMRFSSAGKMCSCQAR